jgi:hypothetical protein
MGGHGTAGVAGGLPRNRPISHYYANVVARGWMWVKNPSPISLIELLGVQRNLQKFVSLNSPSVMTSDLIQVLRLF